MGPTGKLGLNRGPGSKQQVLAKLNKEWVGLRTGFRITKLKSEAIMKEVFDFCIFGKAVMFVVFSAESKF